MSVDRGSIVPGPAAAQSQRNTQRLTLIINWLTYYLRLPC